jgi:3-hydroxybutyrate dehydrogenase
MTLAGKHALVTGGGTGIGLAIAQALAGAGATVTITGRRADVLRAAATDSIHPQVMDVSLEASVIAAINAARADRGPITICVANAGIAEGRSALKTDLAFWRQTMATNLDGAFMTMRACLPDMVAADWGRTIAISSIAGRRGLRGALAYTASKHGLIGIVRGLSEDYRGTRLTFNALCPGYADTDIVTRNATNIAERADISEDAARDLMAQTNRHGRLVDPNDVAQAALWLCMPGSDSVNGQSIELAGGQV